MLSVQPYPTYAVPAIVTVAVTRSLQNLLENVPGEIDAKVGST